MKIQITLAVAAILQAGVVSAFSVPTSSSSSLTYSSSHGVALPMSGSDVQETETEAPKSVAEVTAGLSIPLSFDEMVRQSATAMKDAYQQGVTRQTMRLMLPRSADNDQLLQLIENDADVDMGSAVLVPPDETWQGGIMQLYRVASITCQEMLRQYSRNTAGGVPPRIDEDRSVDESGVDGIGLWITQGSVPADDVSCFVQPSQETLKAIESISGQAGNRLVALLNPQWRITDDALDSASRSEGFLGNVASFLGGKGGSLRRLEELGFQNTYVLEGYVCRGGNVRMIKRFDSDWAVFAENDAATDYVKVGTSETRPTYQDIDAMLESKGISLKYARDIGLAPKLE